MSLSADILQGTFHQRELCVPISRIQRARFWTGFNPFAFARAHGLRVEYRDLDTFVFRKEAHVEQRNTTEPV